MRKGDCALCGEWRYLQRDHVIPRWKGGADEDTNIQLICYDCHYDKTRNDLRGRPGFWNGKKFSKAHRDKLRECSQGNKAHRGFKHSAEACARMAAKKTGRREGMHQRWHVKAGKPCNCPPDKVNT